MAISVDTFLVSIARALKVGFELLEFGSLVLRLRLDGEMLFNDSIVY